LNFDGVNGSTTFTDETGIIWTAGGDAEISTDQVKYGTASGRFENSSGVGFISTPRTAYFDLPGLFTIEFDLFLLSTGPAADRAILANFSSGIGGAGNGGAALTVGSDRRIRISRAGVADILFTTTNIAVDTWTHVAVTRDNSNVIRWFINGLVDSSVTSTATFTESGSNPSSIYRIIF
jgi:hypothetical protein